MTTTLPAAVHPANLSTAYQQGCRCDRCRRHNRERVAAWRSTRPKASPRTTGRQSKDRPTSPAPHRQGVSIGYVDTLSLGQWATANGYDLSTRTYRGAA